MWKNLSKNIRRARVSVTIIQSQWSRPYHACVIPSLSSFGCRVVEQQVSPDLTLFIPKLIWNGWQTEWTNTLFCNSFSSSALDCLRLDEEWIMIHSNAGCSGWGTSKVTKHKWKSAADMRVAHWLLLFASSLWMLFSWEQQQGWLAMSAHLLATLSASLV